MLKDIIDRLFVKKTDNFFVQLIRYTFVGGFAFVVDFGLLWILTEFAGFHYVLSATISFIAGLLVNYFISTLWVFESKMKSKAVEFIAFTLIGIVGLGLNDLFIWLFTEQLHIHYMASKLITAVLVYLWNFMARKYFVFTKK